MHATLSYSKITIDDEKLREKMNTAIRKEFLRGLRAWYVAAWNAIPVYTGMTQASLIPLGLEIGGVPVNVVGKKFPPGPYMNSDGSKYLSLKDRDYFPHGKGTDPGMEFGLKQYEVENTGRVQRFWFEPKVPQWLNNEDDNPLDLHKGEGGRWHVMATAEAAYRNHIDSERNRIKKLLSNVVKQSVIIRSVVRR